MQRIIQIKIGGTSAPIEEDAFLILRDYIAALKREFSYDEGKEIIEDIERRIAELFGMRLSHGAPAIDAADVKKVIETLGTPSEIKDAAGGHSQYGNNFSQDTYRQYTPPRKRSFARLLRDPYNKVIGGVASGIAHFFDIDPTIVRLVWVVLFLTFGIGFFAYIIAWIIIPEARSREELDNMTNGNPVTFHDISNNVAGELQDLKRRGEKMSHDLRDFFAKKKY
jgi:phage shock protein PspC (stress-responsive transcriptional regulator)